jgi:hypothetical protein
MISKLLASMSSMRTLLLAIALWIIATIALIVEYTCTDALHTPFVLWLIILYVVVGVPLYGSLFVRELRSPKRDCPKLFGKGIEK